MEIESKNSLVSIIVPIYNAKQFIERCIKSILNQTYQNWELILVDDGSSDGSFAVCKRYAEIDKRITAVHKENGGVSSARNIGIQHAKGAFITFIDADDWIRDRCIERCINNVNIYNLDIYQFSIIRNTEFNITQLKSDTKSAIVNPLSVKDFIKCRFNICIGGSCFNASLIKQNNIRFIEGLKLAEDQLFLYTCLFFSKRCAKSQDLDYCYYHNPNSATSLGNVEAYITSIKSLSGFEHRDYFRPLIERSILSQFVHLIIVSTSDISNLELYNIISREKLPISLFFLKINKSDKLFLLLSKFSMRLAISVLQKFKGQL